VLVKRDLKLAKKGQNRKRERCVGQAF